RLPQRKNDWLAILDLEGREIPKDRQLGWYPFGLDFSLDCKILAVTNTNNTVRLWNLDGPKPQKGRLLTGHNDWVHAVAFSSDGQKLATGSRDKTVRLWDVATGKELALLMDGGEVQRLAFSSDGKTLASGGRLWDLTRENPQPVLLAHNYTGALAFAPNSRTIAVGTTYSLGIWDLEKSTPVNYTNFNSFVPDMGVHPCTLAYRPDGTMLCVGLVHYGMVVLDTTGRNPKNLLRPVSQGNLVRVAFTPDGKTIVSTHDGSQHQVMITVASKGSWKTEPRELPPWCEAIHT